ncbi:putative calcium-binding protein CML31 [Curcuma longa]|uniref:putative calcium-binding protein CML31 n=1 Tax=Curcuma longa TaxID=136217 RepID=UPI003D9F3F4D
MASISLDAAIRSLDRDGDGKISAAELALCMGSLMGVELLQEEAAALVALADGDGDGLLEVEELASVLQAEVEEEEERDLRAAFEMYESDGEGCITPASLRRTLSRLGTSREVHECKEMICRFDLDGNGVLSFEEFKIMMIA